jgi:hypothetical protein
MIGEIHENLLAKHATPDKRAAGGDAFSNLNDEDPSHNLAFAERPVRDLGFNHRHPGHAGTP